jgi:hypothetical protein
MYLTVATRVCLSELGTATHDGFFGVVEKPSIGI